MESSRFFDPEPMFYLKGISAYIANDPKEPAGGINSREVCFILEGKVTVQAAGETATFGKGDLVTFPEGLSCRWTVHEKVRKHYRFG